MQVVETKSQMGFCVFLQMFRQSSKGFAMTGLFHLLTLSMAYIAEASAMLVLLVFDKNQLPYDLHGVL